MHADHSPAADLLDAYAAGFFDADGTVMIAKAGGANWILQTKVAQVVPHTEVLTLLAERYGGRLVRAGRGKPHHRQAYYWRLQGTKAAAFLRAILPWLTVKRERVLLALEFQALCESTPLTRYNREETIAARSQRDHYRQRMLALNAKKPGATDGPIRQP